MTQQFMIDTCVQSEHKIISLSFRQQFISENANNHGFDYNIIIQESPNCQA